MLDDLDKTLKVVLEAGLRDSLRTPFTITFAAPDEKFPPSTVSLPAINLFLYDVRENRDLRTNEMLVEHTADGRAMQLRPPVRIDCSYLITAWTSEANDAAAGEHALLGNVIRVLLRAPTIPGEMLQGTLRDHPAVLPVSTLQPARLQTMAEMWQAAGGRPKAALHYTVTVPVWTHAAEETHLVTERIVKFEVGGALARD